MHEPADERATAEQAEIDAEVSASGADDGARPPLDTTGRDDVVGDARVWWRERAANLREHEREEERSAVDKKSRADERDRSADERDRRADQRDEDATTRDRIADERDREADQREIDAEAAVSSTDDSEGHGSPENVE